jgi:4-hydroxy-3-polyprenylbenzoate decarboxylase
MPDSFRKFLSTINLKTINTPVSCNIEASKIAFEAGETALQFNSPIGSKFPLVMNSYYTKETVLNSLGLDSVHDSPNSLLDETIANEFAPEVVANAPFQYQQFHNLTLLPAIRTWVQDGGYAFTLPCVITEYGELNIGMYRVQVLDEMRAIIHVYPTGGAAEHMRKAKADGKTEIDAAIVLGAPPAVMVASVMPLKADELSAAGALTGERVKVVKHGNLFIPAESEIVLFGKISLTETAIEGPFGNYTGGYGSAEPYPIFKLEQGLAREDAVCPNTAVGKPYAENCNLMNIAMRLMLNSIKKDLPQVIDFNFPDFGVFGGIIFISATEVLSPEQLSSVPLFRKYKKICLIPKEVDLNDIENCMRLFAYSNKSVKFGDNLIFNCTPENLPLLK